MKDKTSLLPENLFHSYVIEGDPSLGPLVLKEELIARGDISSDSFDFFCETHDSLNLETVSLLKTWHNNKAGDNKKRFCIIGAKTLQHEAQNALLKVIEEPHSGNYFFFVVPHRGMLMETICSRVHILKMDTGTSQSATLARAFLSASPEERLAIIEKFLAKYKDDETTGGVRYDASLFVSELQEIIYKEQFIKNKKDIKIQNILKDLGMFREYLSLSGSSVKMILEHIALMIY